MFQKKKYKTLEKLKPNTKYKEISGTDLRRRLNKGEIFQNGSHIRGSQRTKKIKSTIT